jgi:nitroreductase
MKAVDQSPLYPDLSRDHWNFVHARRTTGPPAEAAHQTLYLMATDMGLGGCAIGTSNIDLFARMTGIEFHVEGPVGQFALDRGSKPDTPD